ncbi:MAG: hypothetical protein ACO3HA_08690 [Burkholderiales bacterium]
MDLLASLRKQIELLPAGSYKPGLEAVLLHIEIGFRHRQRGIDTGDDTAFTDAIYRANQAFEGSVKEAYRVLTNQDPDRKRPADIESYFDDHGVFKARVLNQFTTYRKEWRNPSTHDYKLEFDQSEALLAIVTVAAFASMVLDQIAEHLSFAQSQAESASQREAVAEKLDELEGQGLQVRVSALLKEFCANHMPQPSDAAPLTEAQLIGALHGFLASVAPELDVNAEFLLTPQRPFRADFVIRRNDDKVLIELKRKYHHSAYHNSIAQVEHYMLIGAIRSAVLLFVPSGNAEMDETTVAVEQIRGSITVLVPHESNKSFQPNAYSGG